MSVSTLTVAIRLRWPLLAFVAALFAAVDENEIARWLLGHCIRAEFVPA